MTTPEQTADESLDPGIRDIVRRVNQAGFETSDSGDGVSKPAEWYRPDEHGITEAFDFPHVVAVTTPETMVADARRLQDVLGDGWTVEASFQTMPHENCHLFARTMLPQEVESNG